MISPSPSLSRPRAPQPRRAHAARPLLVEDLTLPFSPSALRFPSSFAAIFIIRSSEPTKGENETSVLPVR